MSFMCVFFKVRSNVILKEKIYFTLNYGVVYFIPQTMKRSILPLNFAKPAKSPPRAVLDGGCYSNNCLLQSHRFCLFLFNLFRLNL
jgi:hypothetical protein